MVTRTKARRQSQQHVRNAAFRWGPIPEIEVSVEDAKAEKRRRKKRKSRWEPIEEETGGEGKELMLFPGEIVLSNGIKVMMPPALTGKHPTGDPELVEMHKDLAEVERKIRAGAVDDRPEHERSPSPPPIYDSNGMRLNTREVRMREKLTKKRNQMIEDLLKKDPTYKPPPDYRPEKKWRKIMIPYKEYPDANFIGLIIGPRGNTQKRMQQETNTRIAIRGKGSVKEGAANESRYDKAEDEDLHVLITGERQEDVDNAAAMIEKLLQPLDDEMNEHKQQQLRELALINGTLKEVDHCYLCGEEGHRQMDCPKKAMEVYRLPDAIQAKVEEQYARDLARLDPEEAMKNDEEYKNFLESLGGTDPRASAQERGGLGYGGAPSRHTDEPDEVKLWIGNLPVNMDKMVLRSLFEPYGDITSVHVKNDRTNPNRSYGFVHFADATMAKTAQGEMNGKLVEGKPITVRRKGESGGGLPPRTRPDEHIPPNCKLFVGNIPPHVDDLSLQREFEKFGQVISAKVILDRDTRQPRGFGFVNMGDPSAASAAIGVMNGFLGFDPYSRPLAVRYASSGSGQSKPLVAPAPAPNPFPPQHAVPPPPAYGIGGGYPEQGYADPYAPNYFGQYYSSYYDPVQQGGSADAPPLPPEEPPPLPPEDAPPLPPEDAPPLPPEDAPPLPPEDGNPPPPPPPMPEDNNLLPPSVDKDGQVQSEYERFMAEMVNGL